MTGRCSVDTGMARDHRRMAYLSADFTAIAMDRDVAIRNARRSNWGSIFHRVRNSRNE